MLSVPVRNSPWQGNLLEESRIRRWIQVVRLSMNLACSLAFDPSGKGHIGPEG